METINEILKKHLDQLKGEEMYFIKDKRNIDFFEKNPLNTNKEDVRNKINAINHHEINKLAATEEMVNHILKLNIDKKLAANDLSVVEDIAKINIKGKQYNLLNFASIYCNFHKPDIYPIYSDQHMDFLKIYVSRNKLNINPGELDKYSSRKIILDDIINRFLKKEDINYFQARKFGWLYIDKVINESLAADLINK